MAVYKLQKPVTLAGVTTSELTFREDVTGNDVQDLKMSELVDPTFGQVCKLAARLCGQVPAVLQAMSIPDQLAVGALVGGFLQRGL